MFRFAQLDLDDIYTTRAVVTGKDERNQPLGFKLCFEDVLVKARRYGLKVNLPSKAELVCALAGKASITAKRGTITKLRK